MKLEIKVVHTDGSTLAEFDLNRLGGMDSLLSSLAGVSAGAAIYRIPSKESLDQQSHLAMTVRLRSILLNSSRLHGYVMLIERKR